MEEIHSITSVTLNCVPSIHNTLFVPARKSDPCPVTLSFNLENHCLPAHLSGSTSLCRCHFKCPLLFRKTTNQVRVEASTPLRLSAYTKIQPLPVCVFCLLNKTISNKTGSAFHALFALQHQKPYCSDKSVVIQLPPSKRN